MATPVGRLYFSLHIVVKGNLYRQSDATSDCPIAAPAAGERTPPLEEKHLPHRRAHEVTVFCWSVLCGLDRHLFHVASHE